MVSEGDRIGAASRAGRTHIFPGVHSNRQPSVAIILAIIKDAPHYLSD